MMEKWAVKKKSCGDVEEKEKVEESLFRHTEREREKEKT
jgi:hypothetical protein